MYNGLVNLHLLDHLCTYSKYMILFHRMYRYNSTHQTDKALTNASE